MQLTESWLRQYSTAPSFERGETYYAQQRVKKLIKVGDLYRAEVEGSKRYHQVINLSHGHPEMTCTCPYMSGGYCKHLVAVGLAILEGEYEEAAAPYTPQEVAPEDLDQVWRDLTNRQQMQFLHQAVEKRPALQQELLHYYQALTPPELIVDRLHIQRVVIDRLTEVDLAGIVIGIETEDPLEEGGEWSNEEQGETLHLLIDRALQVPTQQLQELLAAHNWPNALLLMLGLHEGMEQAKIDRLAAWEPWEEVLRETFHMRFHRLVDRITQEIFPSRIAVWALQTWFDRWAYYEQHISLNRPTHSIQYDLAEWRPLLQALVQEPSTAQFLQTRLDAYQLQGTTAAQLYEHVKRIEQMEGTRGG